MDIEIASLLGDADVVFATLDGYVFAVLGGAHGVQQGVKVDVLKMGILNANLPALKVLMVYGGENLFGHFDGDVDANRLAVGVLALDADMDPLVGFCGSLRRSGERENGAHGEQERGGKTEESPRTIVHGE